MKLYDLPRYSRVKMEGLEINNKPVGEFNFFYIDGLFSVCKTDKEDIFNLPANTEVELICSMREHDLKNLNK